MQPHTIFFIGKPGCGKGTQAKLLAERTGWKNLSSGEEFRSIATEDTPIGRKVKLEVDAGELMPHWFAMYIYLKALFSVHENDSVIFDGFNRKVPEAELVISSLKWLSRPFTILNIEVSDEEAIRRLAKRKNIEGRADDNAVDERLKEYREHTESAIELFRSEGVLVEIQGEQSPEAIAEDIRAVLGF